MPTPPQPALVARSVTMPGLVVSWLSAAAACGGAVPTESAPEPQVAANILTPAGDSAKVTLTYLCGTRWRVRSTAPDTLTVTWDVYRTAETGTLLVPARPAGAGFSEVVFETLQRGTVRLFYQGRLIQTKANGGTPCTAPLWPVLQGLPALDDTKLFPAKPERPRYYRTDIRVIFKQEVIDQQIAEFLATHRAAVIGRKQRHPSSFFLRLPDSGDDFASFMATLRAMELDARVNVVAPISPDERVITNARFPGDASGWRRADWLGAPGSRMWAQRVIRLPLAWGCATGLYDTRRPRVALIEQSFLDAAMNDDLDSALVRVQILRCRRMRALRRRRPRSSRPASMRRPCSAAWWRWVTTASVWPARCGGAQVDEYPMWTEQHRRRLEGEVFVFQLQEAAIAGVRVASVSSGPTLAAQDSSLREQLPNYVSAELLRALRISDSLLLVVSAGNDAFTGLSVAEYVQRPGAQAYLPVAAAIAIRDSMVGTGRAGDRILIVAASDSTGRLWRASTGTGSNLFREQPDLAAPGADVSVVLGPAADDLGVGSGTSFAAPLVAGVAAQLLTMDPTLTPAQVKDYLLRGAREPKRHPQTGVLEAARPLAGTPAGVTLYTLDAYGALTLLARERPQRAPLCGQEVAVRIIDFPAAIEGLRGPAPSR